MARKNRIIISCRFAYLNCWRPVSVYGGQKYSLLALIPKEDKETVEEIRNVIDYVKEKSVDKWGGRMLTNFRNPLHDGDEDKPDNPIFRNCYYLNAKSKEAPQIVDGNVQPITDQTELYSGCYGKVSLTFYAYNCSGNKGIGVWLGNIQKIKDGTPLAGRVSAGDEFTPVPSEDYLQ